MLPENIVLSPQKISEIIEKSGYNKAQLAGLIGVEPSAISKWVKGNSRPEPANAAKLRKLIPASTHRVMWAEFCAKEHASAGSPPSPEPSPLDPKALAETIAGLLAPVLKVNPEALAELLAQKINPKGIAPDVAAHLLSEVAKVVEDVAQKFKEAGQENTSVAVEKVVAACVERLTPLLTQNASETRSRLDALVARFQRALDALAAVFENGLDALGTKADALRSEVQQLQAKADGLETGMQGLGSGVQQLQAQTVAHRRESRLQFLILLATVVAGFGLVRLSHTTSGPLPGAEPTSGGGVTEEAATARQRGTYVSRLPGIGAGVGERKFGRPLPHQPLPHQATKPCSEFESTFYGGCWQATDKTAPCPPNQYQEGDKCYVPVAADSNTPVGTEPKRSGQETPSREQNDAGMPVKEE